MMRGANISLNTPIEVFRQVLGGTFDERRENGWHVVVTPLFSVQEGIVDGTGIFPVKIAGQCYADVVKQDSSEKQLLLPGQKQIVIQGKAFVRVVQWGQGE